ncbi:MAG: nucleotidyltransferase [Candidatus Omnitrophica bacterium]|nr:nucleotidyltransferase [Candidatus Omnitrophota bacterium]
MKEIIGGIDVPDSGYQTAKKRYDDLQEWLCDKSKSKSAEFEPHIYPQGSFRLGTAIKPFKKDDYDLDLTCKMKKGIVKENCTQEQLKKLLGGDLEGYRIKRSIEEALESKHRCWRINYKDELNFHIDIVPCIPSKEDIIKSLRKKILNSGETDLIAEQVTKFAVSITDDRKPSYKSISSDWEISNPEGYALWFENQMKQAGKLLNSIALEAKKTKIEDLPTYKWRTPLQRCVQILKRHRDIRFENDKNGKPISIIITTLAAKAYKGEDNLEDAMKGILSRMEDLVNPHGQRVPNPVNPSEDFADKWSKDKGRKLKLEENFWKWLKWAKEDFGVFESSDNIVDLVANAKSKYGVELNEGVVRKEIGASVNALAVNKGLASQESKRPEPIIIKSRPASPHSERQV